MEDLSHLRKFVAPEIVFGIGARRLTAQYCNNFGGEKIMVVTDPGVIAAGWVKDIEKCLKDEQLNYVIFSDIEPNPRADNVMAGVDVYQNEECDLIVAVGGGSPMDCAKGIGISIANQRHILEFEGIDKVLLPVPPMIFIPTTAGSSADVSQFAIILDRERAVKIAIVSKTIVPDVALIDPETTITMDNYLTVCTGIDALVHAIEAYVSSAHSDMTDLHALKAIRILAVNLPLVKENPSDLMIRKEIMFSSMEAGLAFSNAILGAVHAMAHSLGGLLDLPHGECNAILLDHVIEFNFEAVPERYITIAENMGINIAGKSQTEIKKRLIDRIVALKLQLGITKTLKEAGVTRSDIPTLARKALNDVCILTNPRDAEQQDIEEIYEKAF